MQIDELLEQRKSTHGDIVVNARLAQDFKTDLRSCREYGGLGPVHKECLDNILQKIARMVAGDHYEIDHVRDIIGYATLLKNHIEEINEAANSSSSK